MIPRQASRLARNQKEATTPGAGYRTRRSSRRERKAALRVLVMVGFGLAYFAVRAIA